MALESMVKGAAAVAEDPPRNQRKGILLRLRPLILAGVVSAIIMQIVALSPSSVEEARDINVPIDPAALLPSDQGTLAPGIPKGRVPEYSVDQFNYVSTHESVREWNLIAEHAFLYNVEKLVHARQVKAYLFDPDGKATIVTGKEAKYILTTGNGSNGAKAPSGQRDLEVFGDVKTVFPDGFEVQSEYMRYRPDERTVVIPSEYAVAGRGKDESGQTLSFNSHGMDYAMGTGKIVLHKAVKVTVDKPASKVATVTSTKKARKDEQTTIESDHCVIEKDKKLAFFTMDPERPLESRFVRITQPTMVSKGRRGELNYGDIPNGATTNTPSGGAQSGPGRKLLHYIVLYEDVFLKDTGKESLRYATGGRADFDGTQDLVILTEYPQVYENQDTVTGDRIVLHRDTDVVEVEHSNAFSQGQNNP